MTWRRSPSALAEAYVGGRVTPELVCHAARAVEAVAVSVALLEMSAVAMPPAERRGPLPAGVVDLASRRRVRGLAPDGGDAA